MEDFTITHETGILEVVWRPGIVVGTNELDVLANTVTHVRRWRHTPVLVHLNAVRHVTSEARHVLIAYRHPGHIGILGSDSMDEVLAAFITRSLSDTRYFTSRADALRWLRTSEGASLRASPGFTTDHAPDLPGVLSSGGSVRP